MLLQWYFRKQSYFRLLSPHFPAICQKIPFFGPFWPLFIICACLLAISLLHLCLYWKKVFTGCCCNGICKEKATSGYLHHIFPPFARKFHFFFCYWPFYTICAYSRATPSSHFRFYWRNCYHWVLLQWYLQIESYSRLLPSHSPTIPRIIQFLAIFGHFCPFLAIFGHFSPSVPARGPSLDPISTFIDKNVISGCCCNDIYQ